MHAHKQLYVCIPCILTYTHEYTHVVEKIAEERITNQKIMPETRK